MGLRLRDTTYGIMVGLMLTACAGLNYKYFGLDAASYEGTLLGPSSAQDIPFSRCQPTASNKGPCVVMLSAEWFKAKEEILQLRQSLKDCQGQ